MTKQTRLSLIETIAIATVLAMVSVTVVPRFTAASQESRTEELIQRLQMMRSQLGLYRVQHGDHLPPTDSVDALVTAMMAKSGQDDPYIRKIPVNPYNGLNTVRFDGDPPGSNKAGWHFDTTTGSFRADNSPACARF